jgi:hypothetical protein
MKYFVKMELMYGSEFLFKYPDGFGYDSGESDEHKIASFDTLETAKKQCEMSDEYIEDEKGIIHAA